ncbi:MarR family winged helix-turn-helix transcriptional regulator [Roseibium sediminicola]|uniref:MarR family transcriptional regulator n=1 Tax=Roseibium sediminicola TaxID=2933272 RepID=A0ABT0GRD1_9HYPH|nr:MarR family transcriptional regulator [Roseibium sp. CAU 1639]MCK7611775.1 MarR family transcriptional regulator [Roseibium sp. CAU 1639]
MPELSQDQLSKARLRLWLKLLKSVNGIEAEIRRNLRDGHNTTLPRFDVMSALARFPEGLKMSDLSTFLKVSNGNVTGIVDKLTEEGLAERVAVPGDRRAQLARLTGKGRTAFEELALHHENWINGLLDGWSPEDIDALSSRLELVLNRQNEEDASHA